MYVLEKSRGIPHDFDVLTGKSDREKGRGLTGRRVTEGKEEVQIIPTPDINTFPPGIMETYHNLRLNLLSSVSTHHVIIWVPCSKFHWGSYRKVSW